MSGWIGSWPVRTARTASGRVGRELPHVRRKRARRIDNVAWSYAAPNPGYEAIRGHLAFYAGRVDEAWVGDELATPQPGDFYGGWVTSRIVGPIKGEPGSLGW